MKKIFLLLFVLMNIATNTFGQPHFIHPPKIAIVYIATGNYKALWPEFYASAEKNFLPNYEKHYFVFSDENIAKNINNTTYIYRKWHGFPLDSLDRFELFISIEKKLRHYQYVYFLNANAQIVQPIGKEIFPSTQQKIVVAAHPTYYLRRNPDEWPYERRQESTAYIPYGKGEYYVQGAFIGGRTKDFLEMSQILAEKIQEDKKNNIMAVWHDESHLNAYIIDKTPLYLTPNYVWANYDQELFQKYTRENSFKIVMRSKDTYNVLGLTGFRAIPKLKRTEELAMKKYYLNQGNWIDYLSYVPDRDKFCRDSINDCGTITEKDNQLTVFWEKWPPENFIYIPKFELYFRLPSTKTYLKDKIIVDQKGWTDTLVYHSTNNKYCRTTVNDCGTISFEDEKITIFWDYYLPESFVFDKKTNRYIKIP